MSTRPRGPCLSSSLTRTLIGDCKRYAATPTRALCGGRAFSPTLSSFLLQEDSPCTPERAPESSSSSAVADAPSPAVAESEPCDPMSQLEDISHENASPMKRIRKYYASKRGQNKIHTVTMPEYEPVSHPGRTETRNISLLPTSTVSTWLCIEDIPWLVRWLSDELRSGGVPLPKSDPLDALDCNCEAENVHIRWDFSGAWEAIILQGGKKGRKFTCSVSDLTEEKWLSVGASARYGTDFGNARPEQKKGASFMCLEKHMKDVMDPQGLPYVHGYELFLVA